jgi:hypothetical protein
VTGHSPESTVQRGAVDRLGQRAGGLDSGGIAELGPVQGGANDQLAHVRSGSDPLELSYEHSGIIGLGSDGHPGERIQAVRVNPHVRVAHPHRPLRSVAKALERGREFAPAGVHEPDCTGSQCLPTWIAEAASQREGVPQQPVGLLELAVNQCHLATQCRGEGAERDPTVFFDERQRTVQGSRRIGQLSAEQPRAAE